MTGQALRRDLAATAHRLGPGELRVLVLIASRVWARQARYGCLDLARDRRDFHREAAEEAADGLFYAAVSLLRPGRPQRPSRRRGGALSWPTST